MPTAARPTWAPTGTTCKKRSSSSLAPLPTRSKAWRASCPSCLTVCRPRPAKPVPPPGACSSRSTRCSSWPVAPATTAPAPPSTGSNPSPRSPPRSRSPASTVTANRCPIPRPLSSPSASRAKPPTPWPRCGTPKAWAWSTPLTICNVATSAMVRECKLAYITRAGVEIGVASTKAFTTQLAGLFLLTLALAQSRGLLSPEQEAEHLKAMRHLPAALQAVLALEPQVISWAEDFARKENALFLGRGLHYPIALEGALKLKEITYIHAEAYAAGELKHGPLALVTEEMPVVTIAPNDALIEKLKSNMQEVRARGGQLYVFADAGSSIVSSEGLHVIRLPEHYGMLSPILHVVPLQLLAYHTALARGTDVDKPRNLAKSVTVE